MQLVVIKLINHAVLPSFFRLWLRPLKRQKSNTQICLLQKWLFTRKQRSPLSNILQEVSVHPEPTLTLTHPLLSILWADRNSQHTSLSVHADNMIIFLYRTIDHVTRPKAQNEEKVAFSEYWKYKKQNLRQHGPKNLPTPPSHQKAK